MFGNLIGNFLVVKDVGWIFVFWDLFDDEVVKGYWEDEDLVGVFFGCWILVVFESWKL